MAQLLKRAMGVASPASSGSQGDSDLTSKPDVDVVSILGRESIHCGLHLVPHIIQTVLESLASSTYVLVTDTNLAEIYGKQFSDEFKRQVEERSSNGTAAARPRWLTFAVPPGEQSKSRAQKAEIEDWLLRNKATRDTVILALGGGVVGDLTGFVAATFMRGVRFCQIPTTLLAMVDSAVGGKTAIDTPLGKNLIGAFHQPSFIFVDAAFLESLPRREFCNGMAEVVKTAAIWDADEFDALESGAEQIHAAVTGASTVSTCQGRTKRTRTEAQALLLRVIRASIATKSHIVTIDEKETGLRNLVNFGHTIGHAIEAVLTPDVLHGECVAVGMILEAEVARAKGLLSNSAVGRLARCLKAHGLPTSLSDPVIAKSPKSPGLRVASLLDYMAIDKKNSGKAKKIVLLSRLGKTVEEKASVVDDDTIARVLAPAVRVSPAPTIASDHSTQITPPGSKSISNRALVLAALGNGVCKLGNLLHSDDTQVMMNALEDMRGARFEWEDNGETLVVHGGGGKLSTPTGGKEVYLGNAGTASRFMTTVCTLAKPIDGRSMTCITGNARMKQRPIGPLVDALMANGSGIAYVESQGSLPLKIDATEQGLQGGHIRLAASISSQYVSSILLCAPYARTPITLELVGDVVISQPYIDMTIAMMRDFGVVVERVRLPDGQLSNTYKVPSATYSNPLAYAIESDASSATYPLALAAITGTTCTVANIGSRSLQGDARFATDVLRPMGCHVTQTEQSTTVRGPPVGKLKALGEIDMEPMTDAFLTAAAVAAVAQASEAGETTRIHGIANQRVKECDRIAAMRTQLAKFGVTANELEDGIEVIGIAPTKLRRGTDVSVHCFDDHRVAMAFSVLASVPGGGGAVIEEKRCVEKTWPSWWDDLTRKLRVATLDAAELADEPIASTSSSLSRMRGVARHSTDASIFVLGMRGAGKTHVSKVGASALGWPVIDADELFQPTTGLSAKDFVHQRGGWPAFRKVETQILRDLIETRSTGHIISLGGGVVETPENRELLKAYGESGGPIVHIIRDIDEVIDYLSNEPTRPSLGEDLHVIYERRKPWFHELSNFEFTNVIPQQAKATSLVNGQPVVTAAVPPSLMKGCEDEIARFFRFMTGVDKNNVDLSDESRPTYFLSLTLPSYTAPHPALDAFDELTCGIDALEVRADMLSPEGVLPSKPRVPPASYVAMQIAALRQRSTLPLVFTLRTASQGGYFPDNAEDEAFAFMEVGIKSGCEYIDLETRWDPRRMRTLVENKQSSRIICSWHDHSGRLKWESPEVRQQYELAKQYGDIVKITLQGETLLDNLQMMQFRESVKQDGAPPLVTICTGDHGQMSRILNPVFGPVTHPLLPTPAAPGQLSFADIQSGLHLLGKLPARKFHLFGTPIAHSKSPLIHNAGFKTLGMPHQYTLLETASVDESVKRAIRDPAFGGASVTIPHKLEIIPEMDELSEHAKVIGAVNTIIPVRESDKVVRLRGDNTDWVGMRKLIEMNLTADNDVTDSSTALVLGAGGTCRAAIYALHRVGFKTIYLFNRTRDNAEKVAKSFESKYNIVPLTSLDSFPGEHPAAIISTIPAQGTATTWAPNPEAGVTIPPTILARPRGGVVLDAAYKPKRTPLIDLAERVEGWAAVPGIMMLLEQGYEQFRLWTSRRAPKCVVGPQVLESYDRDMK